MKLAALQTARVAGFTAAAAAVLLVTAMFITTRAAAQTPFSLPIEQTQDYCGVLQDAWVLDFDAYRNAPTIEAKQAAWLSLQAEQDEWYDALCAVAFGEIGYLPKEPLAFY